VLTGRVSVGAVEIAVIGKKIVGAVEIAGPKQ